VLAIVGFFSLSSFKLDHYVFPAAPALCLLSARAWADLKKGGRDENAGAYLGLRIVGPVLMTAGLVVLALLVYLLELPGSALLIPASLLAGGAATTVLFERRRLALIPWLGTAAMALSFCGVQLSVLPVFEEKKVIPEVAAWVAAHSRGDARIATYRLDRWNPAYRFYVRRHVRMLQTPAQAQAFLQEPGPVSVVMLEPAFQELVANGFALRVVHARDGMWVTTGRALWRERSAPTRFVVVARASD
jgi:4-amino-4-deoxy-L-arabinose transferase-like glycosyltransferase